MNPYYKPLPLTMIVIIGVLASSRRMRDQPVVTGGVVQRNYRNPHQEQIALDPQVKSDPHAPRHPPGNGVSGMDMTFPDIRPGHFDAPPSFRMQLVNRSDNYWSASVSFVARALALYRVVSGRCNFETGFVPLG